MGSIGEHKKYLQSNNFSNPDEFDEQVLNDNAIAGNEKKSMFEASTENVDKLINNIERLASRSKLTVKQETEFNQYISTANTVLQAYDLKKRDRRRLQNALNEL